MNEPLLLAGRDAAGGRRRQGGRRHGRAPMIDEPTDPPGLPADELEAFVLAKLRVALEAGALENALTRAGLDREMLIRSIDTDVIDNEIAARIGFQVLVEGLHDPDFDAASYDYERKIAFVWQALRHEP